MITTNHLTSWQALATTQRKSFLHLTTFLTAIRKHCIKSDLTQWRHTMCGDLAPHNFVYLLNTKFIWDNTFSSSDVQNLSTLFKPLARSIYEQHLSWQKRKNYLLFNFIRYIQQQAVLINTEIAHIAHSISSSFKSYESVLIITDNYYYRKKVEQKIAHYLINGHPMILNKHHEWESFYWCLVILSAMIYQNWHKKKQSNNILK